MGTREPYCGTEELVTSAAGRVTDELQGEGGGVMAEVNRRAERTCQMDKSEFADFAPEYEGLHSCHKCGEQTAVLVCVNEDGDMEWIKPRFCGYCGAKVVDE